MFLLCHVFVWILLHLEKNKSPPLHEDISARNTNSDSAPWLWLSTHLTMCERISMMYNSSCSLLSKITYKTQTFTDFNETPSLKSLLWPPPWKTTNVEQSKYSEASFEIMRPLTAVLNIISLYFNKTKKCCLIYIFSYNLTSISSRFFPITFRR